jgi:hypothetical protein
VTLLNYNSYVFGLLRDALTYGVIYPTVASSPDYVTIYAMIEDLLLTFASPLLSGKWWFKNETVNEAVVGQL